MIPLRRRTDSRKRKGSNKAEGDKSTGGHGDTGNRESNTAAWNLLDPNLFILSVRLVHNNTGTAGLFIDRHGLDK